MKLRQRWVWRRERIIGAFAVVATSFALLVVASMPDERERVRGGTGHSVTTEPGPPVTTVSDRPDVDYVIDLDTGVARPLPRAILRSIGFEPTSRTPPRYAASPGGSVLAFVGNGEAGTHQIFIAGIDGSGVRQLTHDPTVPSRPLGRRTEPASPTRDTAAAPCETSSWSTSPPASPGR
jgi:hypothetical protein